MKEEGKELFGPGSKAPEAATVSWSIVIVAFRGDDQDALAQQGLQKVQSEAGLKEAFLEKRGQATVVLYGRYDDPAGKQAKADLQRVKNIEVVVDGQPTRPFGGAFLSPPEDVPGTVPEFDLRHARQTQGDWVLYTLQIGVYSREDNAEPSAADKAEFRKAAEQAVMLLRREGEQAYYYHGTRRSMVTIGLFGKDDFDPQTRIESPTIRALRQRFPYNLNNGMGIKNTVRVKNPRTGAEQKKERLQPSGLVNMPRD